jgi:hypothetical protein
MRKTLICALVLLGAMAGLASAAGVTGVWQLDVQLDQGSGTPVITLKQEGSKLSGRYSGQFGEAPLAGSVDGSEIAFEFTIDAGGTALKARFRGKIEAGDLMRGTCEYGDVASGKWEGRRKPEAKAGGGR